MIEHRETLIYMLYEAAELEHGIMCRYLFAAPGQRKTRALRTWIDNGSPP